MTTKEKEIAHNVAIHFVEPIEKLKKERDMLIEALSKCREWYDNHGRHYDIGLPSCFVNIKRILNETKNN